MSYIADFTEGRNPEYPEKNPRSTGQIKCANTLTRDAAHGHTTLDFSGEKHNALITCATRSSGVVNLKNRKRTFQSLDRNCVAYSITLFHKVHYTSYSDSTNIS